MSIKAKGPKPDPETVARQKIAEQRAEAGRIEATQDNLSDDTRAVIRNFGRLSGAAGPRGIGAGTLLPVAGVQTLAAGGSRSLGGARLANRSLINAR